MGVLQQSPLSPESVSGDAFRLASVVSKQLMVYLVVRILHFQFPPF